MNENPYEIPQSGSDRDFQIKAFSLFLDLLWGLEIAGLAAINAYFWYSLPLQYRGVVILLIVAAVLTVLLLIVVPIGKKKLHPNRKERLEALYLLALMGASSVILLLC
jgi:hypothetical protein